MNDEIPKKPQDKTVIEKPVKPVEIKPVEKTVTVKTSEKKILVQKKPSDPRPVSVKTE